MKTIWKFPLVVTDKQVIEMPAGAVILDVQAQAGAPMLWALVDTDAPKEKRTVYVFGTGNPIEDRGVRYVGTFQMRRGALVFHVFV